MKQAVVNVKGEAVEELELAKKLFEVARNDDLVQQITVIQQGNQRQNSAKVKDRSEVRGGGKKPWRQKHTGRARTGSIRSPLWRGGGSVFGPKPRRIRQRLPKAIRRRALLESLKGKLTDAQMMVLEAPQAALADIKGIAGMLRAAGLTHRRLLVVAHALEGLDRSLRTLPRLRSCLAKDLNALDVLNAQRVLITREAMAQLEQRLFRGADETGD